MRPARGKNNDIDRRPAYDPWGDRALVITSFKIRILNILAGLLCIKIIDRISGFSVPVQVAYVFYVWLATCVLYLLLLKSRLSGRKKTRDNLHFSYFLPGVFYATAVVHYLGGSEWISFFVYFFDLIYANVLLKRRRGAAISVYILFCFFSLIFAEYRGLIPHYHIFEGGLRIYEDLRYIVSTDVLAVGLIVFLLSYSMGLFYKIKESRERKILESKVNFETKSRQLEEITHTLRKKVMENKYLKNSTMGYLAKKEFELDLVKKDLREQIEKLRKTQKSMVFMIEDLNEMSAQLKENRDHLEDKVRARTDELLDISRKLHRSERLAFMGKLAGSVTHELRNPLAVLKNASYYLTKRMKDAKDEKVLKYLQTIEKEISLIDSIIDDIMGFAKTKTPDLRPSSVKGVIEEALLSVQLPELITIEKNYGKIGKVRIDLDQTRHALVNIINNAIMAMQGNGILTIKTYRKNNMIYIEIGDTGPGIPTEQLELIFEPLYSSKPKGTGLGLPIARMMVEHQGGDIEVESVPGKGSVFRIILAAGRIERKSDGC